MTEIFRRKRLFSKIFFICAAFLLSMFSVQFHSFASSPLNKSYYEPISNLLLSYNKHAVLWEEALPIGNGQPGGMVFGNSSVEQLKLNEGSLWGGS